MTEIDSLTKEQVLERMVILWKEYWKEYEESREDLRLNDWEYNLLEKRLEELKEEQF